MTPSKPVLARSNLLLSRRFWRRLLVVLALTSYIVVTVGYLTKVNGTVHWVSGLITSAAAVSFIAFVALGWSTSFYRWWPALDEREKTVLARAHLFVYQHLMFLAIFMPFCMYFVSADKYGLWIPQSGWEVYQVLIWLFYLIFVAPIAIIGWTEPDPPAE